MRELRHDFRRYYGVSYDDVPTEEAVDLIETLPAGSLYVMATDPARSWSELREASADVQDALTQSAFAVRGIDPNLAPRVTRPRDVMARIEAASAARETSRRIRETKWEEAGGADG